MSSEKKRENSIINVAISRIFPNINIPFNIIALEFDSRKVVPSSGFIPLKGNRDGHIFIEAAIQNGARLIFYNKENKGMILKLIDKYKYVVFIEVEDTLKVFHRIAKEVRMLINQHIIAITGTAGKTTTKELLYTILARRYTVSKTRKSYNNHIGIPYELINVPFNTEISVVEVGMNHIGEIKELSSLVMPDRAVITNVGEAHIGNIGSLYDIALAKAEIIFGLKQDGELILPDDIKFKDVIQKIASEHSIPIYFFNRNSYEILEYTHEGIRFYEKEYNIEFFTRLIGDFNIKNIIFSAKIANILYGVPMEEIVKAIESFSPIDSRMEVLKTDWGFIINDAYNSNPFALKEALLSFSKMDADFKIVVIGDMLELGDYAEKYHIEAIEYANSLNFDVIVLYGTTFYEVVMKYDFEKRIHSLVVFPYEERDKLVSYIKGILEAMYKKTSNIGIFFKASNSINLYKLPSIIAEFRKIS